MRKLTALAGVGLMLMGLSAISANAQDSPALAVELGAMSPEKPTPVFGIVAGSGRVRSFSLFAYDSDGGARKIQTGVESTLYSTKWVDILVRGLAGVSQTDLAASGSFSGHVGPLIRIPKVPGLAVVVQADFTKEPSAPGEPVRAYATLRYQP